VKGQPGVRLTMSVEYVTGHRHLPIARLNRVLISIFAIRFSSFVRDARQ
jgi:hypothetical protein